MYDYVAAEKHYRKAIESKPNNPKYMNNLALLFIETRQTERFDEAENLLLEAISKNKYAYAIANLSKLKALRKGLKG